MERYLAKVDATYLIDATRGGTTINTHTFETLVATCTNTNASEAHLLLEAKSIVAAVHHVSVAHVCVTGLVVRKLESG